MRLCCTMDDLHATVPGILRTSVIIIRLSSLLPSKWKDTEDGHHRVKSGYQECILAKLKVSLIEGRIVFDTRYLPQSIRF